MKSKAESVCEFFKKLYKENKELTISQSELFIAGWDARQGEVDTLKSDIVKLKSLIRKQMTTLNNV